MLKMMNPMGSMPVSIAQWCEVWGDDDHGDCSVQSVPGTGDKEDKEDKGMTIEEKKEAERQR